MFELPISNRQPTAQRFHGLDSDDVLYLIMPDRFANGDPTNDEPAEFPKSHDRAKPRSWHGGDLRGIRDHIPYLKDLGVNALWLTPVVKNGSEQDYHGYGAVDLYAVDPHLGSLDDYQQLAAELHHQRMKLFFDAVPNHVGPRHPWVAKPPLPDWFHGTQQNHLDTFAPVKNSFYGKTGSTAVSNDPFEALADPHATSAMRRNITDRWSSGAPSHWPHREVPSTGSTLTTPRLAGAFFCESRRAALFQRSGKLAGKAALRLWASPDAARNSPALLRRRNSHARRRRSR